MDKKEWIEGLRKHYDGPMSEEETDLLRDVQGFIQFAIRNGLSFFMVMATLAGDVNEIARNGYDLKQARARGWLPKVTGYARLDESSVGEPEEAAEPS